MSRIAIVGAGIAGLNAALTLQDAGISSSVYEASQRVGGRMHSDTTTWADNQVSEWCGEFIDGDHETIHGLVQRFGLKTIDIGRADQAKNMMYFLGRYFSGDEFTRDFEAITPILQQQVRAVGYPTTHDHYTQEGLRLDGLSVYDWVAQYVEGGHNSPIGRILNSGCRGIYGMETHEQSALNLLYMFGSLEGLKSSTTRVLQGSSKIAGGNESLPRAIAHTLPEGSVHLNHRLTALERREDSSLALTFATPTGTLEVECEHVILTLPFSTLRLVDYHKAGFDSLKQAVIEQLGYGTISKLALQFDTPYWYQDGLWPRSSSSFIITDLDIQTLWDTSIGQPGSSGLLVDYTSGQIGASYTPKSAYSTTADSPDVQEYAEAALKGLEIVFPGISKYYNGRAALSYPTGDPHLLGSYSCWGVGQYTQFAGYERVQQGPVHFAGEHCSVEFQGYMEGAAREGARAAKEVMQDCAV